MVYNLRTYSPCHLLPLCDPATSDGPLPTGNFSSSAPPSGSAARLPHLYDVVLNHVKDPYPSALKKANLTLWQTYRFYEQLLGPHFHIVVPLRDPLERALSYWRFYELDGVEHADWDVLGLDWDLGIFEQSDMSLYMDLLSSGLMTPVILDRLHESLALLSLRLGLPVELFVPYNIEGERKSRARVNASLSSADTLAALTNLPPERLRSMNLQRDLFIYRAANQALDRATSDPRVAGQVNTRAERLRTLSQRLVDECPAPGPTAQTDTRTQRPTKPLCHLVRFNDIEYESFFVSGGVADLGDTCGPACQANELNIYTPALGQSSPTLSSEECALLESLSGNFTCLPALDRMLEDYKILVNSEQM